METQLHEDQVHPEIARQVGIQQEPMKRYDMHPSLQAEVEPEEVQMVENPSENAASMVENPTPEPVQAVQETAQDRDWRAVRARADEAKQLAREKEAVERERDFYREQASQRVQVQAADDDFRTDTEKQLQKDMLELREQVKKQQQETLKAQQQSAIARAEQRLAQDYPDIREVVSDENIKRLELDYPHLYNSVVASNDVYTVGSAAYEMIIAKRIYQKKAANTLSQLASSSSAQNQSKPRSVSTVSPQAGTTPIKQASAWMGNSISSEDERKSLWEEMQLSRSNRSY